MITSDRVHRLFKKINPQKASGPDNIPSHLLKEQAAELALTLISIFTKSVETSTIPTAWTQANITPIY